MTAEDSTLKKATGPAFIPIWERRVAKKPMVPHRAPAVRISIYPFFCSVLILCILRELLIQLQFKVYMDFSCSAMFCFFSSPSMAPPMIRIAPMI